MSQEKQVSFAPETKNPQVTEKCSYCKHRNIIPQIREMDLCMICFKIVCSECRNDTGLCTNCRIDMLLK